MTYEGKIINKKTIEYLKKLLNTKVQEDYRNAETEEEKEILQALEILSYSRINPEEEQQHASKDSTYEIRKEKTIGDISFGGTTKEILLNATKLREILKYNKLIKNASVLQSKTLYTDDDTFEYVLKDGTKLTFKKPIIQEDLSDAEIPRMEEYLRDFYEKYNKESLKKYYESHKYKGQLPRIKYPHEFFIFETSKKPKLRSPLEKNTYYEKVKEMELKEKKVILNFVKKDLKSQNQKGAKSVFRKKREELFQCKKEEEAEEVLSVESIDTSFENEENMEKKKNMIADIKEGAISLKEIVKNRYKVISKKHGSNFFKKALYGLRAGAGSLTHKETWSSLWKIIKPFAIAGVVAGVLFFTPVGSLLAKGILSGIKSVPLAFGNASKLIPYYLGKTTMSSAMRSACVLNLASLLLAAGIGIWGISLLIKTLKNKNHKVAAMEEILPEEQEESTQSIEKEPFKNELESQTEIIQNKEQKRDTGYLRKIRSLNTQIKELETVKANLNDSTTKKQNEEVYYNLLLQKLKEKQNSGEIKDLEEERKKLDQAKNNGILLQKYNDEIIMQLDKNIAILKENVDLLIEEYERKHFGGLETNKELGLGSLG